MLRAILIFVTGAADSARWRLHPLILLWHAGVFEKFWFWTINYALAIWQLSCRLSDRRHKFFSAALTKSILSWLAGLGARGDRRTYGSLGSSGMRAGTLFLLGFLFFSALAVCPGFYFRHHYFILVLPAVSLLAGAGISKLAGSFWRVA